MTPRPNEKRGGVPGLLWPLKKMVGAGLRRFATAGGTPQALEMRYDKLVGLSQLVGDELRRERSKGISLPVISSFDGQEALRTSIMAPNAPWMRVPIETVAVPGMISDEECRYYTYIGRFHTGAGEAVELGPWLGRSTHYILNGLRPNPHFRGKRLHVFDDFVWRPSWMDNHVGETERLQNHQEFRFLFEKYTAAIAGDLLVERRKIIDYDGNEHLPALEWKGGPVEVLYVDCGRTFAVNDRWYSVFREAFIPNRTLIVMQDWRLHREVPVRWFNQTKQFTDSKGGQLDLVHEVNNGGVATFLFRG